ncbi:MAG: HEPN domain-containing protein [Saccharolobus sp.]
MKLEPLYERAYQLLDASKFNFNHGFYEISVIASVQALYILINAKLIELGADIPWYLDFDGLFRILDKYTGNSQISDIRRRESEIIKNLDEIKVRLGYSVPLDMNKEKAYLIITFVERVFKILNDVRSSR